MRIKREHLWSMEELAGELVARQNNDFDNLIIIDGNRGIGKSTLAYKILQAVARLRGEKFNPKEEIVFERQEVIKKLDNFGKYFRLLCDEMIAVGYKREFWNRDQIILIKMFNMYRDKCGIIIMCVPDFFSLDKDFLNLISLRISVRRRGFAVLHMPSTNEYDPDKWDIKKNIKIESKFKKDKPDYKKISTWIGYLQFGDLKVKQKEMYLKLKEKKRSQLKEIREAKGEDEMEREDTKEKERIDIIMKRILNKQVTREELFNLAQIFGYTYASFLGLLRKKLKEIRGFNAVLSNYLVENNNRGNKGEIKSRIKV